MGALTVAEIEQLMVSIPDRALCARALHGMLEQCIAEAEKRGRQEREKELARERKRKQRERDQTVTCHADVTLPISSNTDQIRDRNRSLTDGEGNERDKPVMDFVVDGGDKWQLSQDGFDKLAASFPAISPTTIKQELAKAAGWLFANPSKRKTAQGMMRFLFGWLSRTKPQAPVSVDGPSEYEEQRKAKELEMFKRVYSQPEPRRGNES